MSNIKICHLQENNHKCLIPYGMSPKALVHILIMAESNELSCSVESDDDSFLSGSVNYSTECTDDQSISDISILAEMEVQCLPYRFKSKVPV